MNDTSASIAANGKPLPVRVDLTGAANMRDLGGYPARSGTWVRSGRLYRSDSPHRLVDDDIATFERLGVRTIVDLRSYAELDHLGRAPLSSTLHAYLHAPLRRSPNGEPTAAELAEIQRSTLGQLYCQFVTHSSDELRSILLLLSDERAFPALFYCVAGKDRTGIVAAIILELLGVPDEVIAADYAATADSFERFIELTAQDGDRMDLTSVRQLDPSILESHPETMLSFLRWMRSEFGSVEDLVAGIGIGPAVIAALRHNLVTNEPAGQLASA
jgi:protein-tyrosine phosphatase